MLLIRQDVDRTIPEVAFFQSEKIRTMMCNILFIHAKIDPGLCYKQGMHEILGRCPTIFPVSKNWCIYSLFSTPK